MGKQSGQLCIITRCNYTLFNEAVNVCCANNNTKVGFVGVSHILSLICLYSTFITKFSLNRLLLHQSNKQWCQVEVRVDIRI